MTKFEIALNKFAENPNVARKDFIARLVAELGMTESGASTYHYNCKKKFAEEAKPVAAVVVVAPKTEEVKKPVVKTANTVIDFEIPAFLQKGADHWDKFGYARM